MGYNILQIVYSAGNRFQVRLYLEKRTPETMGSRGITTNVIYLTFESEELLTFSLYLNVEIF